MRHNPFTFGATNNSVKFISCCRRLMERSQPSNANGRVSVTAHATWMPFESTRPKATTSLSPRTLLSPMNPNWAHTPFSPVQLATYLGCSKKPEPLGLHAPVERLHRRAREHDDSKYAENRAKWERRTRQASEHKGEHVVFALFQEAA